MNPFQPVRRRSGVSASVRQTKRIAQMPVSRVMSLSGFGLTVISQSGGGAIGSGKNDARASQMAPTAGARAARKKTGFSPKRRRRSDKLVVFPQVHAAVQRRDLIA